jgi:hypothetical protein
MDFWTQYSNDLAPVAAWGTILALLAVGLSFGGRRSLRLRARRSIRVMITTPEELHHGLKLAAALPLADLRRGHPHWPGHKPLTYQFDVPAQVVLLV